MMRNITIKENGQRLKKEVFFIPYIILNDYQIGDKLKVPSDKEELYDEVSIREIIEGFCEHEKKHNQTIYKLIEETDEEKCAWELAKEDFPPVYLDMCYEHIMLMPMKFKRNESAVNATKHYGMRLIEYLLEQGLCIHVRYDQDGRQWFQEVEAI